MTIEPARALLSLCAARGTKLATAESCTGGLIAAALTAVPGSSAVVDRGFVTYSNEAKAELLGVLQSTLARFGAVSAQTAAEMAAGALTRSQATFALSVTGIAGPGGGSAGKPVGTVWFGFAGTGSPPQTLQQQFGDLGRDEIRNAAVRFALQAGLRYLRDQRPQQP